MKTPEEDTHISSLDGLRGIAALSVLFFHYTYTFFKQLSGTEWYYPIYHFINFGWLGIDLFFVLSGFLITRILLKHHDSPHYYKTFYCRRVLRIFPIYYTVLFFYLMFYPFDNQFFLWTYSSNIFPSVKIIDELSHFWSLAVEEHFYLLWPIAMSLFFTRGLITFCSTIIVLSLMSKLIMFYQGFQLTYIYHFSLNCFDAMALGSLLAILNDKNLLPTILKDGHLNLTFTLMTIFSISNILYFFNEEKGFYSLLYLTFTFSIYFCVLIQLIYKKQKNIITKLCNIAFLRRLGLYSYGIYLFHLPMQQLTTKLLQTSPLTHHLWSVLLSLCLTVFLSGLSYHLIESKFLSLKKHFQY